MKESSFIDQNKDNWRHYENVLQGKSSEPDELNDLFIQVTDDLSYARSFYPNRSVRVYLNNLAQQVFLKLYTNRKRRQSFFIKFFRDDLPAIMFSARKEMLVCFMVFLMTFLVGVFSSRHEPGFARQILGDRYVEMTKRNIKEGKPMEVYSQGNQLNAFFAIAYNNLRVDMLTFVTGLFFAIGTLFVLSYNGVMVGVFQYFFYGTGFFTYTVLTIWLHGTLEIFTMILSATAGLVFGKGLIMPGTYSRSLAFRISAIKGVKILLAVIPLTLTAAFIEAFITGQSQAPLILKGSLIIISLLFILFYFVWLPYYKFSGTGSKIEENEVPHYKIRELKLDEIKTTGEIVADTFGVWKARLNFNTMTAFGISLILVGLIYLTDLPRMEYKFISVPFDDFSILKALKINMLFRDGYYQWWMLIMLVFSLFPVIVQERFLKLQFKNKVSLKERFLKYFLSSTVMMLTTALFYFSDGFLMFMLFYFIVFPIALSINAAILSRGTKAAGIGLVYFFKTFFSKLLLGLSMLIMLFIIYMAVTSPITGFITNAIYGGLKLSGSELFVIQKIVVLTLGLTTLFAIIPLYIYSHTLHFFSSEEKLTAISLRANLQKIWS